MGLYLSMSGIVGVHQADLAEALKEYAVAHRGRFEPTVTTPPSPSALVICESAGNCTVVYPGLFEAFEGVAAHLSRAIKAPVFFFHVHDGDLWTYVLYVEGEAVDQFYSMSNYFGYSSDDERKRWQGNAATISHYCPNTRENEIRNYLMQWDLLDEDTRKAYTDAGCPNENVAYAHEDDEHPFGDCLQVVDFMRKLGFRYPFSDEGEPLGETSTFFFELPKPKRERNENRSRRRRWRRLDIKRWMVVVGAAVMIWVVVVVITLLFLTVR